MLWYVILLLLFKEVKKIEEKNMSFQLRMKSPARLIGGQSRVNEETISDYEKNKIRKHYLF